ncbi:hypothetical protein [Saliterribacillus persicus]|uniref:Uncharacterized protein n=1 Tax=Saliterribacillus persicus TaxID=930114 RepID=A0A368XGR7_9BACI|nr:hypothetical protein [Saliterribacillus persicus]RCW67025.1 hypothetical protein DFR57_108121 [Saliterribacillus persicus]
MNSKTNPSSIKLLRSAYPQLYDYLIKELSAHNIHSFDIQATSRDIGTEVEIQVQFGEEFNNTYSKTFSKEKVTEINDAFSNFCEEIAETCKETLIADYFKMVKP